MELSGLYREVVETSPDGIWVFDLEGRTLYVNPALARMFGADPDEFANLSVPDTLDSVGRDQFAEHLAALRRGELNPGDVECRFVRRDGTALWVLVSESPLRARDGSVEAIVHRLTDFSARRSAHDGLTASQRQLAEAQRIARLGSWEWDVELDQIVGSQGLYELYGYQPGEFGGTYADFLGMVHPEDRPQVAAAVQGSLRGRRRRSSSWSGCSTPTAVGLDPRPRRGAP